MGCMDPWGRGPLFNLRMSEFYNSDQCRSSWLLEATLCNAFYVQWSRPVYLALLISRNHVHASSELSVFSRLTYYCHSAWMNEDYFVTWLLCLLIFNCTMCPYFRLVEKTKSLCSFKKKCWWVLFKPRFEKWVWTKLIDFLPNEINNPASNFTRKKLCFLSTEWYQRWWNFLDVLSSLGAFQSVAVLRLCAALPDAYSTSIICFCCGSIDIQYILLHVKFKGWLFISFLRNRATLHKKVGSKTGVYKKFTNLPPLLRMSEFEKQGESPRFSKSFALLLLPVRSSVLELSPTGFSLALHVFLWERSARTE